MPVGSVRPTEDERERPIPWGALHDRKERDPSRKYVSMEQDKEQDGLVRASRRNETKNKTILRTTSENRHGKKRRWWLSTNAHNLAPISCSATPGNKTKNKTLAFQPIALSRTGHRAKQFHQRREQGPRALLTKRSKALPNPRSVPRLVYYPPYHSNWASTGSRPITFSPNYGFAGSPDFRITSSSTDR